MERLNDLRELKSKIVAKISAELDKDTADTTYLDVLNKLLINVTHSIDLLWREEKD